MRGMKSRFTLAAARVVLLLLAGSLLTTTVYVKSEAAEKKDAKKPDKEKEKKSPPKPATDEEKAGIGYGGAKVQLAPMMAPYRTSRGVQYQVVIVRMTLDVGVNEKPACFMIPIIHEKFLLYFNKTQPTPADFVGQRKDVMLKALLDLATETTDRGFYAGVELVDETSPPMDPKSQTLSVQCK